VYIFHFQLNFFIITTLANQVVYCASLQRCAFLHQFFFSFGFAELRIYILTIGVMMLGFTSGMSNMVRTNKTFINMVRTNKTFWINVWLNDVPIFVECLSSSRGTRHKFFPGSIRASFIIGFRYDDDYENKWSNE